MCGGLHKDEGQVKVYFPALNGLRFFAAMLVVFGHVELLKEYHGYSNLQSNLAVYELGRMGVTFFFVLIRLRNHFERQRRAREAGRTKGGDKDDAGDGLLVVGEEESLTHTKKRRERGMLFFRAVSCCLVVCFFC